MNCTLEQAETLLDQLAANIPPDLSASRFVVIAVPFPYLVLAHKKFESEPHVFIAAQNCYTKKSGAYTGEVSVEMLRSIGIAYVVIGHSERREYFNEDNAMLAEKVNIALACNMHPIFCCG